MRRFTMGSCGAERRGQPSVRWFVRRDNADGRSDVVCDLLTEEQARACEVALNKLDERSRRRTAPPASSSPVTTPRATLLRRGRIRGS